MHNGAYFANVVVVVLNRRGGYTVIVIVYIYIYRIIDKGKGMVVVLGDAKPGKDCGVVCVGSGEMEKVNRAGFEGPMGERVGIIYSNTLMAPPAV